MPKLTWQQAATWRVHRHHLVERAPAAKMLAVVSRLCGLQAQLMSSAELTLWARLENLDRQAVQRALWQDRTLVKTWAMRGTLHLLPSTELPLWHAALGTSSRFLRPAAWQNYFGISMDQLDQLTDAISAALDGNLLTREELAQEVSRRIGPQFGAKIAQGSWGTILRPAAFSGRLCFAPSVGQRVRFTHPATWVTGSSKPIDAQQATAEVTRRFLGAYGPATNQDLARWWNGGGVVTARQWIAALGEEVTPVDLEGAPAWMLTAHVRKLRELSPLKSVRLLPAFDQYVIGASYHAEHLLPGVLRSRVYRPQGWISPVLLVNGRMQGVWRHEIKGSRVEVEIEPFIKLPAWVRRAAGQEAELLAAFLNLTLSVNFNNP
jgi:uncharacterized protein YcaQ